MRTSRRVAVPLLAALACASRERSHARVVSEPGVRVSYTPSRAPISNPERGFYRFVDPRRPETLRPAVASGETLVFMLVRLDEHRESALDSESIAVVSGALDAARDAGVKVVLRFAYNNGPFPGPAPDASPARVVEHIRQLRATLRRGSNIIAVVQAGFLGAWGEWHSSARGHVADEARRDVVLALLDALPPDRMIQLRFPADKSRIFSMRGGAADAVDGAWRVGHHNDCLLASDDDAGTWPAADRARWEQLVARDGLTAPIGGETCRPNLPRTGCAASLAELDRFHYSFVNHDWHPEVIAGWRAEGCVEVIERRLGYRFRLLRAVLPRSLRIGTPSAVHVTLRNDGWAATFNPRPVVFAITCGAIRSTRTVPGADPRRWHAGADHTIDMALTLTARDLGDAGSCELALCLPDAASRLGDRPAYAVRFANDGTWDSTRGCNRLGVVAVEPTR